MARLYVEEIGWFTIKESKEEVLTELKTENPVWADYTKEEDIYGVPLGKIHIKERLLTIRTENIIAIE